MNILALRSAKISPAKMEPFGIEMQSLQNQIKEQLAIYNAMK